MIAALILYYNDKYHIREAVTSVISQTIKPNQFIIIDNGSTDGGLDYLRSDPGIRIVKLERNFSLGAARNFGLKNVNTDFVAFLDSDDVWELDKIEILASLLQSDNSHFIHSNFKRIDDSGSLLSNGNLHGLSGFCADQHFKLGEVTIGPPSTVVARVESLRTLGGFSDSLSISADWDLNQRMARNFSIDYIDRCLVLYRVHENNFSKNVEQYFREMNFALLSNFQKYGVSKKVFNESRSKLNLVMAGEMWQCKRIIFLKYLLHSLIIHPKNVTSRFMNSLRRVP